MKKVLLFLLTVLASDTANAASFIPPIASIPCNGESDLAGGNQIFLLENYMDSLQTQVPSVFINEAAFWWDGAGAMDQTTIGNISYAIDPGQSYMKIAGYPATQYVWPQSLLTLGIWETAKKSRQEWRNFAAPRLYTMGADAIFISPECFGGGVISGAMLGLFTAEPPVLPDPPPQNYLLNSAPMDPARVYTELNPPLLSVRSAFAVPFPVTSLRVHISWPEYHGAGPMPPLAVSYPHVGVSPQSGSTSSASAPFTELTFNKKPGVTMQYRQWAWSDCVSINVPTGGGVLVSLSLSIANNPWTYANGQAATSWLVFDPSQWNAQALSGTITTQPGRVHVVDRVQVNCK
jgi:hypothetical protein